MVANTPGISGFPRNPHPNFENFPAPGIFNLMIFAMAAAKCQVVLSCIVYSSAVFCRIKHILSQFSFLFLSTELATLREPLD